LFFDLKGFEQRELLQLAIIGGNKAKTTFLYAKEGSH
jgi:hypothetical protein